MKTYFYVAIRFASRVGLVVGPCFLLVGLGVAIYTLVFLHQSVSSTGKVVSLTSRAGDGNTVNYFPVFTFTVPHGREYTIRSDAGSNPSEFQVGQSVPVKYKLTNPEGAKISSFWQLWTFPTAFGVSGILFGGFGLAFWIYERRTGRPGISIAD